uniref:Putative tbp-binding protein activator of basal transcription n=1 Tax=Anopheles braziliensis TaxID=58242 RepID=A0A2M3ZDL0_9DIPT
MNVTILRDLLQPMANVDRVYMQPECKEAKAKKRTVLGKRAALNYTEAWVEFNSRREARLLATRLNAQPISTSRKSVFCDILWNMKYLPQYTWVQLSERLSYEKAVGPQKHRAEIAQARKEAAHFQANLDRSLYRLKRRRKENHGMAQQIVNQ